MPAAQTMTARFETVATPRRLAFTAIAAVVCLALMTPLDIRLHAVSGGLGKPSLVFGGDANTFVDVLRSMGADGRRVLTSSYAIDLFFPIALAATSMQAVWLAFRRSAPRLAIALSFSALSFWLLDLVEKTLSFIALAQFPDIAHGLAATIVGVTSLKLVFLALTYIGLIAAFGNWVMGRLRVR